tara:strand:+ start:575 stop:898 length:324 start_codon:yes stop_codon:yes gene_type:complete
MPIFNRNYSMLKTPSINSAMSMSVGRTSYNVEPIVTTPTKELVRNSGTKSMTLLRVSHNNKATMSYIRLKNANKKHNFNEPEPFNPITLTNLTNNNNPSVNIITHNR